MRELVFIKTITALNPIKDADRIEEAIIDNGWPVVVKKGEFKVGDKCVFFEIDSLIPVSDPRFKFLEKTAKEYNGILAARLRTVRLKKTLSQGLALPLTDFPELATSKDYAATLKVVKYVDPNEAEPEVKVLTWRDTLLKYLPVPIRKRVYKYLFQKTSGNFPSFVKVTDQCRCQRMSRFFEDEFNLTQKYEITIKEDGSSLTCYRKGNEIGVCSRERTVWNEKIGFWNFLSKKKSIHNEWYDVAYEKGLVSAVKKLGKNIAVQGEFIGPKKNGNRAQRKEHDIYIFDIWDIDKQMYVGVDERREIVAKLIELGYKGKHVHVVAEGTLKELDLDTIPKLLNLAAITKFPGIEHLIEGVVVKRWDGQVSFKAISNEYLIKHNL